MPPDISSQQMISGAIGNALSNIPSLDLPSAKSIVILLGVYILLVGPINYLLLRWRDKLQWGWVTIPIITLLFSALSFGIGYAKRGTDLIINKIAIIQGHADGRSSVTSYIGLFSPANQAYEIEILGDYLLSPMSNHYNPWMSSLPAERNNNHLTFLQGDPSKIRGLNVNQWSMQSFMTENILEEVGPFNAYLTLQDQDLIGTVTNRTGFLLKDVVLILEQNFVRLGDIANEESVEVDMHLNSGNLFGATMSWKIFESEFSTTDMRTPDREQEFKRMVLEAVIDQQNFYGSRFLPGDKRSAIELTNIPDVTVIGWMDFAPPDVRINAQIPQESTTSLFTTKVTYQLPQNGEVLIPAGLIPGIVAEMPFSAGTCGVESASLWIEKGEAIIEFLIPSDFSNIKIQDLQFLIQTDGGWNSAPEIAIYNWTSAQWQPLDESVLGLNFIEPAGEFIDFKGLVRFRISPETQDFRGGACYYTGLGLRGTQ
jgi:hypothetical protein